MDTSFSDVESLELDENISSRWRAEMFYKQGNHEDCGTYVERLDERRKYITEELQKLLQLTPHSYDAYFQRTQGRQLSPISEKKSINNSKEETAYLQIRSEPIVLHEPEECGPEPQNQFDRLEPQFEEPSHYYPRPFLKRGSGLARFHMSKNDFIRPPELYKKKEFKSYLKGNRQKPSNTYKAFPSKQASQTRVQSAICNAPIRPTVLAKSKQEVPPSVVRNFDDEVIPTLRGVAAKCSEIQKRQDKNEKPPFKVPKAPMQNLVLKQTAPRSDTIEDDRQEEKENRIFEILEQRVEESDFCSQNSSVQKLFDRPEFTPALKPKKLLYGEVSNKAPDEVNGRADKILDEVKGRVEKALDEVKGRAEEVFEPVNDNDDFCDDADSEPQHQLKVFSEHDIALRVKRKALQDNVKKIFECNYNPRLKATGRKFVKKVRIKKIVRSPKKESINLRELKIRLVELEKEKNAFQRDNNKLKRIQKEVLDEKMHLDKRRREEEKRLKEEHEQVLREKEALLESQKKFYREKVVFEKYCKETKSLPSREDREEIRKMKEELEKLKEVLNTKEARFGAAQARLRNQVKALESENRQLKNELAEAKKTTVKKVSFDSQAVINSKIINAINQQLGKKIYGTKDKQVSLSAREPKAVKPKPLRRAKSAVELKQARMHLVESTQTKSTTPSAEISEAEDDAGEEPRIIDMLGPSAETSAYFKRSDSADSGVGSRPSVTDEDSPKHGCTSDDCCPNVVPSLCQFSTNKGPSATYTAIMEMKNRVRTLADKLEELPKIKPDVSARTDCCPPPMRTDSCCYSSIHSGVRSRDDLPISKRLLPNGDTEELYGNGKKKLVSGCGDFVRIVYPNGDIREEYLRSLREKFFYRDSGLWQTTFKDRPGYQQLDMPDGRTVVYHPDGNTDTLYPNGNTVRVDRSGTQEWRFKTGEIVRTDANGDKILMFPDGRKEFTSKDFTRLEESDGTIKTLYKDGRQETKLPSGRVRIKDRHGNVIMDTAGFNTVRS